MTIAFAENVSDKYNNDIIYHVEWLDSEKDFPSLGSETMNNKTTTTTTSLQDWQILKKQDIYNDDDEQNILALDGKRIKVSEMEDKWEEIQYEKQYVDVAENAASLPLTNNAPIKPLRHQPKKSKQEEELTEEELKLHYWDQLDQLILEENNDFYDDIYYNRKTQSTRSNKGNVNHLRRRLEFLSLNNQGIQYLSLYGNRKAQQFLDTIPSTHGTTWGTPKLNGRLLHGLTHLSMPSYLSYYQQKHSSKNTRPINNDVDITLTQ